MTGPDERLDTRCSTAARLLGVPRSPGHRVGAGPRVAPDGRFAALRTAPPTDGRPRSTDASPAHPSWAAAAVAALPVPVARRLLDRLGPLPARAVLAELDREHAARLQAGAAAHPGALLEGLLGRRAPPVFPPAPPWAAPPGVPDAVARAAAREPDWPAAPEHWAAAEALAAEAARHAVAEGAADADDPSWPDDETARGLARLAFALFDRPDEAWGLAGAWPRRAGLALLAAWDAWPDLGAPEPHAAATRARAARRLRERWSAWAA
ncbi:MAG: hypothetical protein JXB32_05125 [Deltaproteobacteria bacterium]|nr:hypothetical protein [Deltaproteobacteria bacterium]